MTDPMQKITALCEKHGFTCLLEAPHTYGLPRPAAFPLSIQFDRNAYPVTSFQVYGASTDLEQIYQKFLAVLQAIGWESPTPTGISAAAIPPGPDWYEVIDAAAHDTLEVGDKVQMVESPIDYDNFLYRSDGTLHNLQKADGNYFTLISKPLPTPDAPPPTPIHYKIEACSLGMHGWNSDHTLGALRFTTKVEAEGLCAKEYPYLWSFKELRVVIADD
jgi:hypothetical protein